ncbi:hypothetical protein [Kitasatospora aureofaciens]|uniref:hypothetical protein n=1 Tax=Kitasatospora aureofaciens TaxID=1894 RepID=UPI0033FB40AB
MSYADNLTSAAALLRTATRDAKVASPTPWVPERELDTSAGVLRCADGRIVADRTYDLSNEPTDLAFLALANPDLGLAVASWLDDEAAAYQAAVTGAHEVWPDDEVRRTDWLARRERLHPANVARLIHEAAARNSVAAAG